MDTVPFERMKPSFNQMIETCLMHVGPAFEADGVELIADLIKLPPLQPDEGAFFRMLEPLLDNAREAAAEQERFGLARVVVRTRQRRHEVVLEIADNGSGFEPDRREQLLEPGFSTRGRVGMGLSRSLQALAEIGGTLAMFSHGTGRGATIKITFPLTDAPTAAG